MMVGSMNYKRVIVKCVFLMATMLFSCETGEVERITVIGGEVNSSGLPSQKFTILVKGINEVVCPPIVFCDDEEVISSYETETDRNGRFVLSIEPHLLSKEDFFRVRVSGKVPGASKCITASATVYPGQTVRNLMLSISCVR